MANVDVFIVAGQSNAQSVILSGTSEVPSYLATPDSGVKVWDGSAFVTLQEGFNSGGRITAVGPEWAYEGEFLYHYRQDNPSKTVYLIKRAEGGTSLAVDWDPAGSLFGQMETFCVNGLSALVSAGHTPTVRAMLWMQGESDANNQTRANAYEVNLNNFISNVRSRCGDTNTRFILGRIIDNISNYPYQDIVRPAQQTIGAQSKNAWIDTDSYPIDVVHYTAPGQALLGQAMYTKYLSLQSVGRLPLGFRFHL